MAPQNWKEIIGAAFIGEAFLDKSNGRHFSSLNSWRSTDTTFRANKDPIDLQMCKTHEEGTGIKS